MKETEDTDAIGLAGGYDNERWGLPIKSNRYDRVGNRKKFSKNFEDANLGRDVNPAKGRRFHIVIKTKEVLEKEEADRRFKEGLKELYPDKKA